MAKFLETAHARIVASAQRRSWTRSNSRFCNAGNNAEMRKTYRTRDEARADVFDYIERFYNTKRRHSTIGYLSPMEFETKAGLA